MRALISVCDKTGIVKFAQGLVECGYEIVASGGTAATLKQKGIKVMSVEEITGTPPMFDGRVKTLHPKIHSAILANTKNPDHVNELNDRKITTINLVVCNFYNFEEILNKYKGPNSPSVRKKIIEKIDIGGPAMVRAAAKNVDSGLTVVIDPNDYDFVLNYIRESGTMPQALRRSLTAKAFKKTSEYDNLIFNWCMDQIGPEDYLPDELDCFRKVKMLRYGENPHQKAALYKTKESYLGVANGHQLHGKELSYNNYLDMDSALKAVESLPNYGCAIIKHKNACGFAYKQGRNSQVRAFRAALSGDPISAFGSVIGFNGSVRERTAAEIIKSKLFVECIVANGFDKEALKILKKKKNLRLVRARNSGDYSVWHAHKIGGGILYQTADINEYQVDDNISNFVTKSKLSKDFYKELCFAMTAVKYLKSNAIAITKDTTLIGMGTGQPSRIDATEQAIKKAGDRVKGSIMASDAFFPFRDCVDLAAKAGVVGIIQPGGSKRDKESIDACNEHGIAMVFTGKRHFRH